jgi:putative membrane protein
MLVINAIVLLSTAALVRGFEVQGFWAALWGALLLSVITLLLGAFLPGSGRLKIERDA